MKLEANTSPLEVWLGEQETGHRIGRLAWRDHTAWFEFDEVFLASGLDLSPFHLPPRPGVHRAPPTPFDGLHGLFNDSLPDGWGRLLIDRQLMSEGTTLGQITPLDRLSIAGSNTMGALTYRPSSQPQTDALPIDLDTIQHETAAILSGHLSHDLERLAELGGSSAGARPKITVSVSEDRTQFTQLTNQTLEESDPWIIKFKSSRDPVDIGNIEYAYSLMAIAAGLEMPETHLFTGESGVSYFGIKRFDRSEGKRLHVATASGLLHADHRLPSLDYTELLKATHLLTRDMREVEKMYRLACFNVLAHNRDDHAKNFSFLMSKEGNWTASPPYDLTYSDGPGGEHSTMIAGSGKAPEWTDLENLARTASLKPNAAKATFEEVAEAIKSWPDIANQAEVSPASRDEIATRIAAL